MFMKKLYAEILDLGGGESDDNNSGWWSWGRSKVEYVYQNKFDHRNTTTLLYHQTSPENANKILKEGFKLGLNGLAGRGIYFASNQHDTSHKARSLGAILECKVRLGKAIEIDTEGEDITYKDLKSWGGDSVLIPRRGGDEYVVYNPKQVESCKLLNEMKNKINK